MKASKKKVLGIAVGIVVLVMIAGFLFWRSDYIQHWRERKFLALWEEAIEGAQRRRVLLLCNTDHQALLKAGREILSKIPKDRLNNPYADGGIFSSSLNVPEGIQIPQAIKDLKSSYVVRYEANDSYVSIYLLLKMHWGMDHFGVKIYLEDYKKPRDYFKYGDRELLPGLWYYDDGYIHNPEYDKRIDKLINEHRRLVK
jgi:hypothetical protein